MSLFRALGGLTLGLLLAITPFLTAVDSPKADKAEKLTPAKVDDVSLEGYYSFEGDILGTAYEGISRIKRVPNGNLMISWYGAEAGIGIGMRDGHELVVGWTQGAPGVTRFQIELDEAGKPRLVGQWITLGGPKGRHKETMTWLKALPDNP